MFDHSLRSMDIPTLVDCDCKAIVWNDKSGVEIEYCPKHEAAPALVAACKAMLPVVQYILKNGWDEAPPLFGTTFDEVKANELAINALAQVGE